MSRSRARGRMEACTTSAQLTLDIDPARHCKPWRRVAQYDPCGCRPCQCFAGCWECAAVPGEPGCAWCWHADADGFRLSGGERITAAAVRRAA